MRSLALVIGFHLSPNPSGPQKIKKIMLTKMGRPRITAGLDDDVTDSPSLDAKASVCCPTVNFRKRRHKKKSKTSKKYLTKPGGSDRLIGLLNEES